MTLLLSDVELDALRKIEKMVSNPKLKPKTKFQHIEINYELTSINDSFCLYVRQNKNIEDDFSCGLRLERSGEVLTLCRYNGSSHNHGNKIEGIDLPKACYHIHYTTNRYILASKKPEGYAEATSRYESCEQALKCLIQDCNVLGFDESQLDLFA